MAPSVHGCSDACDHQAVNALWRPASEKPPARNRGRYAVAARRGGMGIRRRLFVEEVCAFRRSRPLVPIDRDQCEGAVRCIFWSQCLRPASSRAAVGGS